MTQWAKCFNTPNLHTTHYQQADTELIKRSVENFDRPNVSLNCNPNEQVCVPTKTVLNIISIFIANETILAGDRDPPWITSKLKCMIQEKIYFIRFSSKFSSKFGWLLRIPRRSVMKTFK